MSGSYFAQAIIFLVKLFFDIYIHDYSNHIDGDDSEDIDGLILIALGQFNY